MLAEKMMGNKGGDPAAHQGADVATRDLSVDRHDGVGRGDVAMPAGFKEKK